MRRWAVVLILTTGCGSAAASSRIEPPAPIDPPARHRDLSPQIAEFDRFAGDIVQRNRIPGLAYTVVQGQRVLAARGHGVVEVDRDRPVTEHTVFRLASLSKGFAGTLAAMLVREGALRWDAPVIDYLPALTLADRSAAAHLTVRDILSHQIGIHPYNFLDRALEADQPYPLLAARLGEAPMRCQPGRCYAYQNIAFSLISDVSFAVTGEFFPLSVTKRVLGPLGMRDASYGLEGLQSSPDWARPHVRRSGRWQAVAPKENYYRVPPAAGVNASAADMGIWLIALLGHRPEVMPAALLAEIYQPQVATPDQLGRSAWRRARVSEAHYALGWRVYTYGGHRMIYHAGAVQGYRAIIALIPERDIGMAVLWHHEHASPSALLPLMMDRALGLDESDWYEPELP